MVLFKLNSILILALVLIICSPIKSQEIKAPDGLLCELLRFPEKALITDQNPEFGWIVDKNLQKQVAYRILVASSMELLNENDADFWDSKIVNSSLSVNVEYVGKPLAEHSSYWWKVKVWGTNDMESNYSEPQQFNTSVFNGADNSWPGESNFRQLPDSTWVSENRQTAEFQRIEPVTFEQIVPGTWVADFGKAAFATLELTVSSEKGDNKIELFLGERRNADFTVNKEPGVSNIGYSKVNLVLKNGTHKYLIEIPPHFSKSPHAQSLPPFQPEVLPFRYVEINGKNITVEHVTQPALFYPFNDTAATFQSSNQALNSVWDLCKYTLKATPFLGVYADGNRERMPYEADAYIQQLGHTCVDREYALARYTANFLIYHPSWPTEWQMHILFMAWEDYMQTGNSDLLLARYDELTAKTLMALTTENGLISTKKENLTPEFYESIHFSGNNFADIVDWPKGTPEGKKQPTNAGPTPEGERDGYVFTDFNTVVNAFHYRALIIMSKIAKVLEKEEDKVFYATQAVRVKDSIYKYLFDAERGIFIDGIGTNHAGLHANMLPLAFGMVDNAHMESVAAYIKSKGMVCSVYGAQYLLDALFNAGEVDYALSLITSGGKRSWLNMINVGSTMTTEAWDEYYKPNLTWNHAWGTAPANIITRRVMGVEPIESAFKKFKIVPQPGNLQEANLKTPTIRGTVTVDLKITVNSWEMEVEVPGNTEAEFWVPAAFSVVTINTIKAEPGRKEYVAGEQRNIYLLKSGSYTILAKKEK